MAETITISLETTTQELTLYVDQAARGPAGADGPAGPAGETGPAGEAGPQGETGPAGSDANVTNANVNAAIETDPAATRTSLALGSGDSPTFYGLNLLDGATATLNVYNVLSGLNFETLAFRWASNVAYIGTSKGGTGVARDMVIETNGTERARFTAAGVFTVSNIRIWNGAAATSSNVAVGPGTLIANIGGSGISCFGSESMASNTFGNFNVAFGENSLSNNTTGNINVAIGNSSGRFIADGTNPARNSSESVFIGASARPLADNQTNQIAIGRSAIGLGSNTAVLGNDSVTLTALKGNVAIGATTAASKLTVTSGDIEVATIASGLILKSPNGTRWRVTVDNSGALTTASI